MSTSDSKDEVLSNNSMEKPDMTVQLPLLPEHTPAETEITSPLSLSPAINTPPSFSMSTTVSIDAHSSNNNLQKMPSLASEKVMLTDQKSTAMFKRVDRFGTYINYGFGVPFSYWKDYNVYPFVEPKYESLKEEFLQNTIYPIKLDRFTNILEKGQSLHVKIGSILGQNGDKNTPVAREITHWNDYCNIKAGTLITLNHLLSILYYTDLTALTTKMKVSCRKIKLTESVEDVKNRQVEFVHWLKFMNETLIFYGNRLSTGDDPIYHGLSGKFMFDQFKAQFHIPTSTTTDRMQATCFAGDSGIVLQFGGLESVGDPYFDTASISAYPTEKEYLFFRAELHITDVYMAADRFSMKPLSLYQSIVGGLIIIDKLLDNSKNSKEAKKNYQKAQSKLHKLLDQIEERKQNDESLSDIENEKVLTTAEQLKEYGIQMLENFIDKNKNIYINPKQIIDKIALPKLRARFIKEDQKQFLGYSDPLLDLQKFKVIKLVAAETYVWTIEQEEFDELKKHKVLPSKVHKLGVKETLVKFYSQINCQEKKNDELEMKNNDDTKENEDSKDDTSTGRMSLILHKFGKHNPEKKTITISCDFFCKQMDKFYVRFHSQTLILGGEEEDTRVVAVFKWNEFIKAFEGKPGKEKKKKNKKKEKEKKIEWIISIRKEATDCDDEKINDDT